MIRILSCYIRAFGTLKDLSLDFGRGLNQYLCDNGVGKTTLLAFIKSMLYGLEYRQGSRANFYERIHYTPWGGESFGGSMSFALGESSFRVERTFGKKRQDDTCVIYDIATGRPSDEFDENLGEALFGVDSESFEKSVFFGQGSLDTGITGSINAKMGNLSDMKDDMNRFEEALKRIDKARMEYESKSSKNPGRITAINARIKECEKICDTFPALETAIHERKQSIETKKRRLEELSDKRNEISEAIKSESDNTKRAGIYSEKVNALNRIKAEREEQLAFFSDVIPEESEIEDMISAQKSIVEIQSKIEEIKGRLPEEERQKFLISVFGGDEPATREMLERSENDTNELIKLRAAGEQTAFSGENEAALAKEKEFFKNYQPDMDEIEDFRQLAEGIKEKEARIEVLQFQKDMFVKEIEDHEKEGHVKLGKSSFVLGAVGLLIALLAALYAVFLADALLPSIISVAAIVLGIAMVVMAIAFTGQGRVRGKQAKSKAESRRDDIVIQLESALDDVKRDKDTCLGFIGRFMDADTEDYSGAIAEILKRKTSYENLMDIYASSQESSGLNADALSELSLNLYTRLAPYSEAYGYDLYNDHNEKELISKMKEDFALYDEYLANMTRIKDYEQEASRIGSEVALFIGRFNWTDTREPMQMLSDLKLMYEKYNSNEQLIGSLQEELREFSDLENREGDNVSIEELQRLQKEIDEEYEPLLSDMTREEEELSGKINDLEEVEEAFRRLDVLIEQRNAMKDEVGILNDTKAFLTRAREEFLSVYMKPLRERMGYYTDRLLDNDYPGMPEISLDMDLTVSLIFQGSTYSGEHLSEGQKDLVALCSRLALIDVLYKKERPVLLMDDPFSNMDEDKIQKALKIIKDISEDSQIIYLTCHESRTSEGYGSF